MHALESPALAVRLARSQGIDVLRGLAVLFVVLHHIHIRFRINKFAVTDLLPPDIARVFFWSGYYSVIAFFVISGFLITTLTLRRWQSLPQIRIGDFYRLRAARILPCLLLLLSVLSALHLAGFKDYVIKPEQGTLGRALFAALTFHVNWLEGQRGYLPGNWDVLWSLSVEEAFYIVFPIACLLLRRERFFLLALIALIVIGPFNRVALEGQREPWDSYAYLSCMDGIAFGSLAGWICVRTHLSRRLLHIAMTLGVAAVVLIVVFRSLAFDLGLTAVSLNVSLMELGVALVLLALSGGVGESVLSKGTGLIRLAGRCSYEIYLTHMFVVLGLMHPFKAIFGSSPTIGGYWFSYALMLTLSVALGYFIARGYSEPLNRKLRGGVHATAALLTMPPQARAPQPADV